MLNSSEYIIYSKREGNIERKKSVSIVGMKQLPVI